MLKAANGKDYTHLQAVIDFYGNDFTESELSTQLQILSSSFPRNQQETATLHEVIRYLQGLANGQKVFFKQVCKVASLILVVSSTNAASERSFSVMKRVKMYLRSTMRQSRLNHLMTLNIYKDVLDKINLTETAIEFERESEHRLFGKF